MGHTDSREGCEKRRVSFFRGAEYTDRVVRSIHVQHPPSGHGSRLPFRAFPRLSADEILFFRRAHHHKQDKGSRMAQLTRIVNILLLYPETPNDTYWSFSHCLGMIGKKAGTPPLGLLTVAGMLPTDEFSLRLIDMNVQALTDDDLAWADIVFASAMIAQKTSLEATLARIKAFGKTTVAGGPYTSTAYRDVANVDVFFIGEAEGAWDSFLADLRSGSLKPAYAAPVRQREIDELSAYFGPEAHIVPSETYPDLNLAPMPRFDLLDLDKYACMTVQASRGCPVGCEFCDIWRRYGRKSRTKAPERILAEMDELHRLGWRDSVFLVDDNFIGNRMRAREMLAALVEWQRRKGWPFAFLTETTLSLADDPEMLDLMAEAGFASVFVGIETPSEASLRETGKHINLSGSMADKAVKIQEKGIQLMSGFIIGFDADPDDIADRMTACIQELGIPQAMVGLLNALPDTDLYERLEAENRILTETTGNNTHAFAMNFLPARPEAEVLRDYKDVLRRAYPEDMKAYFERCEVLRQRWPNRKDRHLSLPLGWKVRTLARYLLALASSSYRLTALRFLLKTLVVKPAFLEQAIELGIKGHHHWAITRQAFEVEAMRATLASYLQAVSVQARKCLEPLEVAFEGRLPRLSESGEEAVREILSFLTTLGKNCSAPAETAALRTKIEETIAGISMSGKRVRQQAEKQYRRLSHAAREILLEDMRRFSREVDRYCAPFSSARLASGGLSERSK